MTPYVEHANITVGNIDLTVEFIQTALPSFAIRHCGQGDGYRWCHIGTELSYLALQEVVERESVDRTPYRDSGINHIGLVTDDIDSVKARLLAAGYTENEMETSHPWRKRIYFWDPNRIEWEFIEYLSQDDSQRNDYSI
ncbi:VOC family protein [Photobacterium lutimaris]|uniref:Lactoylglutathione lyase n=1 Tax=Photobacterium lutimaris TaxID=388278 RepID=A0A2T3IU95_9GAMM|nr:VOC family protein [Photobacterium lutimaris]PSU31944.1 lactoylglutathione lyase [Photobacterium lutimaris]TDR73476.1 glyoxalase/bleomycin resistance protein/dioxygenase superfamily protein [Photobacterium lutimaris]